MRSKLSDRSFRSVLAVLLLLLPGAAGCRAEEAFRVETISEGVSLFLPVNEKSARTNSLVVERDEDLLVVEAQPTPAAARELLAAIQRRTDKPVRFLVISHPHAEAAGGASAFPAATQLIGAEECLLALEDPDHDFGAEMRALADEPDAWEEPVRRLPDIIVYGRIDLADSRNTAQVFLFGNKRHTAGDLLVALPDSELLYVGGLLFSDRNPYAVDGNVGNWLAAFNSIIKRSPGKIVGLRGPAADIREIRQQRDSLAWLRGQVESKFVDGASLSEIREEVLASPDIGERFAADASPSFLPYLVDRVIEESAEHRRKRGMPVRE